MKISGRLLMILLVVYNAGFAQNEFSQINIGEKVELYSKVLNESRSLYISYPSSFNENNQKYPVLFLLDGDYYLKLTAGIIDYLSYVYDIIPEMIIVGIGNTDRMRDMTPSRESRAPTSGGADKFYRFFTTELIPYIEKNYPVTSYKIIAGHSLGGLFTLYSLIRNPDLFKSYIAISPSINWNNFEIGSNLRELFSKKFEVNGYLFMSMSTEGAGDGYNRLNGIYNNIKQGSPQNFDIECKHYPSENHLTTFIPAITDALKSLFNDWRVPQSSMRRGIEGLKTHFAKLKSKFGYEVPITADAVNTCGNIAIHEKRYDDAFEIYQYYISGFPRSAHGYLKIGEVYLLKNDKDSAVEYFEKALRIDPDNKRAKTLLNSIKE